MMTRLLLIAAVLMAAVPTRAQEVTGLSDWSIFLDPGHSQNENVGYSGYSEARKVLQVGLAMRDMLEERTDIGAVYMSRTNDQQSVSLSQRTAAANASGADYFHSIHSNAAGPTTNYAFVLWAQLSNGNEPNPPYAGGRSMAEILGANFGEGMRIPTPNGGAYGECDFYGASSCGSGVKGSRNYVQRNSLMPSTLSEAGFHTSTTQNPRNMNADWKVLEAQAMFWGILEYNGLERTPDRIATGIISDAENEIPVNGATITIAGESYTTDTFESLFSQYASDPDLLHNGFYYLPMLPAGTHDVTVTAPGYRPASGTITMLEGEFTFYDVELLSNIPPVVTSSDPEDGQDPFRLTSLLTLEFSRPMDRSATEAAFSLVPSAGGSAVNGTFSWHDDDTRMVFRPEAPLSERTEYVLTLAGSASGAAGDPLDGDADGTGGDDYAITFTTSFLDTTPPGITAARPGINAQNVELRPLITLEFSEPILPETVEGRVRLLPSAGGTAVPGTVQYRTVGEKSAISFFPSESLAPNTTYVTVVSPGLEDHFGNVQTVDQRVVFTTGEVAEVTTLMEDFESGVADDWWVPQQSGSTAGIDTDSTDSGASTEVANVFFGGDTSLRVDYGWDLTAPERLIRQYREVSPPSARTFTSSATLRATVFGDGSGTLFRFAVRDAGSIEVSPWTPIDWIGWNEVTWDISEDGTGAWIGDGTVDGTAYFDSFQFSDDPSGPSATYGHVWIDDLRLADLVSTDEESGPVARSFQLSDAFPNPVRAEATFRFTLAEPASVTATVYNATGAEVARLAVGETRAAGDHDLVWDTRGLAAGVYFVRVSADDEIATSRVTVIR